MHQCLFQKQILIPYFYYTKGKNLAKKHPYSTFDGVGGGFFRLQGSASVEVKQKKKVEQAQRRTGTVPNLIIGEFIGGRIISFLQVAAAGCHSLTCHQKHCQRLLEITAVKAHLLCPIFTPKLWGEFLRCEKEL